MANNKYDIRTQDYKTQRTMAKTFAYMLIGWGTLLLITGCLYAYDAIATPGSGSSNMAGIIGASFALIGIVLQVSHIGNVAHIAHFVTEAAKVPEQQIKRNRRTGMSQMRIAVDSRPTDIKSYERRFERNELLFATGKGIVNAKFRVHMHSFSAG